VEGLRQVTTTNLRNRRVDSGARDVSLIRSLLGFGAVRLAYRIVTFAIVARDHRQSQLVAN
jgi:hypothetical protein